MTDGAELIVPGSTEAIDEVLRTALEVRDYRDPHTYLAVDPDFTQEARARILKRGKRSQLEQRAARMAGMCIAIQAGAASVPEAAALVGCSRQIANQWLRRGGLGEEPYATFVAGYMSSIMQAKMRHVGNIERAALEDWRASEALLKRLDSMDQRPVETAMEEQSEEEQVETLADYEPLQKAVLRKLGIERGDCDE